MEKTVSKVLVTIALTAAMSLAACSEGEGGKNEHQDESDAASMAPMAEPAVVEYVQDETSDGESTNQLSRIESASIVDPGSYKDGVAWVTTEDARLLIDDSGMILLNMEDLPYSLISSYHQGAALGYGTKWTYDYLGADPVRAIVDRKGETVWSAEEDGQTKAEEVYGADNVLGVSVLPCLEEQWNGFLVVAFDVDTFDFTGTTYGVVDAKGTWVVEPPMIEEAAQRGESERVYYAGNLLRIGEYAVVLYRTGEVLECTRIDEMWGGVEYGGIDINELEEREKYLACRDMMYSGSGVFKNSKGEIVLDLGEFPLADGGLTGRDGDIAENAFAESDYCLVTLENSQGGRYITVVDASGKQMFDPIREGDHGPLSGNAFFYDPGTSKEEKLSEDAGFFVDVNGNPVGELKGSESKPFSEGRAWILSQGEWRCIDERGAIVF